jgi:hypothetical protein
MQCRRRVSRGVRADEARAGQRLCGALVSGVPALCHACRVRSARVHVCVCVCVSVLVCARACVSLCARRQRDAAAARRVCCAGGVRAARAQCTPLVPRSVCGVACVAAREASRGVVCARRRRRASVRVRVASAAQLGTASAARACRSRAGMAGGERRAATRHPARAARPQRGGHRPARRGQDGGLPAARAAPHGRVRAVRAPHATTRRRQRERRRRSNARCDRARRLARAQAVCRRARAHRGADWCVCEHAPHAHAHAHEHEHGRADVCVAQIRRWSVLVRWPCTSAPTLRWRRYTTSRSARTRARRARRSCSWARRGAS